MGEEYDMNDPIIIYMNNLKTQLNLNAKLKQMNAKSLNSDESDNSQEYEFNSQTSDLTESDYGEDAADAFHIENYISSHQTQQSNKKLKVNQDTSSYMSKNKKFKNL